MPFHDTRLPAFWLAVPVSLFADMIETSVVRGERPAGCSTNVQIGISPEALTLKPFRVAQIFKSVKHRDVRWRW
jgi:hypothetical protein